MIKYSLSVDLAGLSEHIKTAVDERALPLLNQAVRAIAQATQTRWMEAVYRAKLWSVEKDRYMQSITWRMTGPFSAVVETDYEKAQEIEVGRPARDLKRMLYTSMKVRRTRKHLRRFLIIPFRHDVKNMPSDVYAKAKALAPSMVTGQGTRPAGEIVDFRVGRGMFSMPANVQKQFPFASDPKTRKPVMVTKRVYKWGDRMPAGMMGPNPRGKVDQFAGMVRFDTSAGGKRHSVYMTFRTMSETSKGWIVPPKPGLYIAQRVTQEMKPLADKVFAEAIRRSLRG